MKEYEALFIFSSSLKEDALQEALEQVNGEITKLGGNITNTDNIGKRSFARPLKGMEVTMDPDKISPLLARLKLNESVFRTQIVKAEKIPIKEVVAKEDGTDAGGE